MRLKPLSEGVPFRDPLGHQERRVLGSKESVNICIEQWIVMVRLWTVCLVARIDKLAAKRFFIKVQKA